MAMRGRLLADENPYRSLSARRGNPADASPYQSSIAASRSRLNPADQSPYRSSINPAAGRSLSPADESPYRSGIGGGSVPSGSAQSLARRRARPPPLETVTPISPVAPMSARRTAPGREPSPARKAAPAPPPAESTVSEEAKAQPRSPNRPLDIGPAEVRLHAENAQAIARLHAEHSQRLAQLLMGTIECRPSDLEGGGSPDASVINKSPFALCGGCCGTDKGLNGGPSAAALQARRTEIGRLNALHAQTIAKQESLHQRQKTLLQVDMQRKDLGASSRPGSPTANTLSAPATTAAAPRRPGAGAPTGGKAEPRRGGLLACCGKGPAGRDRG